MLAVVRSAILLGVEGQVVTVEVHVSGGLPAYTVVGLPDAAVRESRDRVRAALLSSGLPWPQRRITVNLAPSALPKSGTGLDLAVATALLLAGEELPAGCLDGVGVVGEVGLDGSVRPVRGVLAMSSGLREAGVEAAVVPAANAAEAALAGIRPLPAVSLAQVRACLKGEDEWPAVPPAAEPVDAAEDDDVVDLAEVRGLAGARTALAVAAAGGHHLLLVGPPGVGKTMLARCLPSILPPLEPDEALEVTRIHSAAGAAPRGGLVTRRPFRAPHHTATVAALVGGGTGRPTPGEVTLAHRGVLFMDELGEFPPPALDALRQPLEERVVRIARQQMALTFPACFTFVASSNPCPCGLGPPMCSCDEARRARYRRRLSAPILDRFDLRVLVSAPEASDGRGEASDAVAGRVREAVGRQRHRYRGRRWRRNAEVPGGALRAEVPLARGAAAALHDVAERARLTGRGVARVVRVARTLADLDGAADVTAEHVVFASTLRQELVA